MTLHEIIWLFPLLFIFHDLEEIILLRYWTSKNASFIKEKVPKFPITKNSTPSFAIAVTEEFLIIILISLITRFTDWYLLWIGFFIAYTIHLIIHIFSALYIKRYIPSLITSLICLPICIYLLFIIMEQTSYTASQILLFSIISIVVMYINLFFIHKIMNWIDNKIDFR